MEPCDGLCTGHGEGLGFGHSLCLYTEPLSPSSSHTHSLSLKKKKSKLAPPAGQTLTTQGLIPRLQPCGTRCLFPGGVGGVGRAGPSPSPGLCTHMVPPLGALSSTFPCLCSGRISQPLTQWVPAGAIQLPSRERSEWVFSNPKKL